jgi:hypothetical protein
MAKVQTGSNAQFLGPNQGLTVIGKRCYAMSGAVSCSNAEKTLLDFSTENKPILCRIKVSVATPAQEDDRMRFIFRLNGSILYRAIIWSGLGGSAGYTSNRESVKMIIPPLSRFEVLGENITDSSSRQMAVVLAGKIIDA